MRRASKGRRRKVRLCCYLYVVDVNFASVHQLIDAEIAAGIPSDRIVVGGFSMGGALALYRCACAEMLSLGFSLL